MSGAGTEPKHATKGAAARLGDAARAALGLGLLFMVTVNVAAALGRYSGLYALIGADELLVYAMIWIVMLGAILALATGEHLSLPLAERALSGRGRAAAMTVAEAATLAVCVFVAFQSWDYVSRIAQIGQTSMALGVPMAIPHAAVFVGFAGMALAAALSLLRRALRAAGAL